MSVLDARGIPRALFTSSAGRAAQLTGWDAAIRRPLGSVRRIGFIQLGGRAGVTTLAREVLRIAASRRPMAPLAVDASESGDLATSLGAGVSAASVERRRARSSAEAVLGLDRGPHGEWVLRSAAAQTDPVGAWVDEAAPITRFFEVAVTDFGSRHPNVDMATAAALCDVVCLVSPALRGPAEVAHSVAQAIADLPEHPQVVLALTDLDGPARLAPEAIAAASVFPVVRVPRDLGLAQGRAAISIPARESILTLAAALIGGNS